MRASGTVPEADCEPAGTLARMTNSDWPFVSVVIPMLNAEKTIGDQLEAIAAQSYPGEWEVIVADNGSIDASVDQASVWADRIRSLQVVDASAERGPAFARNFGVNLASGRIILMCDADDAVADGWITALVEGLRYFDIVRGSMEYTTLNSAVVIGWHRPLRLSRTRTSMAGEIAVPGGNFGTTKDIYEALGGWLTHDLEFSIRARAAGLKLGVASDAVVSVRRPSDLRSLAASTFYGGKLLLAAERADSDLRLGSVDLARIAVKWMFWLILHLPLALISRVARGRWVRVAALGLGWASGWVQQKREN